MTAAVKICGVCSAADAAFVAELGADYIGVILTPGFARTRALADAASIYTAAAGVRRVGVFVDTAVAEVRDSAARLALDVVQLHGTETPEQAAACRAPGRAVWKAVAVRTAADVKHALAVYADHVDALLLDGAAAAAGGGGEAFRWREIAPLRAAWPASLRLVIAGGLDADNVSVALTTLQPDVVDVSSGVEAVVGKKSRDRLERFLNAARASMAARPQ
jgi:phosphoribosylanthranilate isomerase